MESNAEDGENVGPYVRMTEVGNVRVVTLARPERTNALVPELIDGVRECVIRISEDEDARAVVLTALGRHFSTGGDVAAFAEHDGDELVTYARAIVGSLNGMIVDLMRLRLPVVAAARGAITGGSLGLLLASDVVLLAPDAFVAPYYVDVGFSPDGGWTAILPHRIGRTRAAAIQFGNQTLDARRAVDWGLALDVAADVEQAAIEMAQNYASKKVGAVARTKVLLRDDLTELEGRLGDELVNFVEQIQTHEARVGMDDFLSPRTATTENR